MKAVVRIFCWLIGAMPMSVPAAINPVAEAVDRGLAGKTTAPKRERKISPEQWRREQLAAVDKSDAIMRRAQQQPGLLTQYALMRAAYDADKDAVFQQIFVQYLAWFQTWIGDYDAARHSFSVAQLAQSDDAPPPTGDGFRVAAANAAILDLSKNRRAVFFNEAHSAPLTRTLTIQLLAGLRAQGFTTFAAESLSRDQTDLLKRGYPTAKSGFYLDEPIYGEMVRAALKLGFKVIAYDADDLTDSDAREKAAAQSLYQQVFKNDPQARLVVNAGYSHIQKSGKYLGGSSMAEYFAKISGVDPLSVEQTMMIEHSVNEDEHPIYRAAVQIAARRDPFVFMNAAGKPWTLKPGRYDVSVFFPRERQIANRPDWINLGGSRKPIAVNADECAGEFPCLIEAHYATETADGVAADRYVFEGKLLKSHSSQANVEEILHSQLTLYPGAYRISALRSNGQEIASRSVVVGDIPPSNAVTD